MTSTILTRRTMLSGSALLGLGTLLAACGQQAANEAGASAPQPLHRASRRRLLSRLRQALPQE